MTAENVYPRSQSDCKLGTKQLRGQSKTAANKGLA